MTNMECSQQQAPQEQTPPAAEAQQQRRQKHQRIKLTEINSYLTCHLCRGYLIDATTISECLHSFCRSCIIKYLQENSHCPVCEVPINKAKPNLKLDKTLQDIVYKLVPELFLSEMCRRQMFYRKHPEQAGKVSPEQRGEDTERTIFNPRDTFSLSIEYISDDSTPGAILLPSSKQNIEANKKNGCKEPTENMMRRFLQCPGMCRVDVLKKFVRNKYNVDTNRFHIDILYKRVPLPDHYTLIDIAYIYSWKRNEPMKFFFRITDVALVKDRFDYLEPTISLEPAPPQSTQTGQVQKPAVTVEPVSTKKTAVFTNINLNRTNNTEIITKIQKVSNKTSQPIGLNIIKQTVKQKKPTEIANIKVKTENGLEPHNTEEVVKNEPTQNGKKVTFRAEPSVRSCPKLEQKQSVTALNDNGSKHKLSDNTKMFNSENKTPQSIYKLSDHSEKKTAELSGQSKACTSDISEKKTEVFQKSGITVNAICNKNDNTQKNQIRMAEKDSIESQVKIAKDKAEANTPKVPSVGSASASVEIKKNQVTGIQKEITKIDRYLDVKTVGQGKHEREALLLKIRQKSQDKSVKVPQLDNIREKSLSPKQKALVQSRATNSAMSKKVSQKRDEKLNENFKQNKIMSANFKSITNTIPEVKEIHPKVSKEVSNNPTPVHGKEISAKLPKELSIDLKPVNEKLAAQPSIEIDAAKEHFLKSIELTSRKVLQTIAQTQKKEVQVKKVAVKRKNSSPLRAEKPAKRIKAEKKKPVKVNKPEKKAPVENLKTLLNTCKIPSSLSITCVNGDRETQIKPVINHIEILKLPEPKTEKIELDEKKQKEELEKVGTTMKPTTVKDEDKLKDPKDTKSELSITITIENSEKTDAPKPPIGVHPNLPKMLPSAVPPRSNHSFQKMFEETIKKPEFAEKIQKNSPKTSENNSSPNTGNKRNILEIASQLYKKTKLEQEKNEKLTYNKEGKVAIPRLINQKSTRTPPSKTGDPKKDSQFANMHSASLGMNYTVSVNQRGEACDTVKTNPTQVAKPEPYTSPRVLPPPYTQHSPRSAILTSPRPGTASPRAAHTSPRPAHMSPRPSHTSPRPSQSSPTPNPPPGQNRSPSGQNRSPSGQNLDPNQLLEKYNIQNLAQLTASFNFNPSTMANLTPANQLAIHQAMLYKHLEMQNRQNWLSMNSNPLAQYEKYLQSLNANGQAAHLLSNIKEN